MAGIGFITKPGIIHGNDPVQDANFLRPRAAFTQAPTDLNLERFLQLSLVPIQMLVR